MAATSLTPRQAFELAIEEAKKGEGFVSPNPLVGCVILDKNQCLLAKGFHSRVGADHAEVDALKKVPDLSLLRDAELYVTLEPCAHQGRTPSCAKTLSELPIKKVVYGIRDPFPLVSGKGAQILREAGVQVSEFPEMREEFEELSEVFLTNILEQRAFVALKVATSLDGKVALSSGESQWITGGGARERSQYLRGCYDSVLIGVGTFLSDDPSLNLRHPHFSEKSNKVILLDPRAQSFSKLRNSKLMAVHQSEDIVVVIDASLKDNFQDPEFKEEFNDLDDHSLQRPWHWQYSVLGCQVVMAERTSTGQINLPDLLGKLFELGIPSVFCEGGGKTFSGFFEQDVVDRLFLFQNASLLGQGRGWTEGLRLKHLSSRLGFSRLRTEVLGEDFFLTGKLKRRSE